MAAVSLYPSSSRLQGLPLRERPAYRVAAQAEACSLAELLAVIAGGSDQIEIAERLIERFGSIRKLSQAHPDELSKIKGVGNQTALRLKASIALGRKLIEVEEERPSIHSQLDAANLLRPKLVHLDQEHLAVLLLDAKNRVMELVEVYRGSANCATIRMCELFKEAVRQNAVAVILSHNHPSGDPKPSPEDVSVTRSAVSAGKLLDIQVMDHIIIGSGSPWYVSLRERGLGGLTD